MRLGEKQELFSRLFCRLLYFAHQRGYEIRLGDVFRDPRVHGEFGIKSSYASAHSVHKLKLAGDLNLFKDGVYLTKHEDHEPLGMYWESLNPLCRWGGHFGDSNHYSLEHQGYS